MQALCTTWMTKAAVHSVSLQRVLSNSCCTVREETWLLWLLKDWFCLSSEWHMMALHQKLLRSELEINFYINVYFHKRDHDWYICQVLIHFPLCIIAQIWNYYHDRTFCILLLLRSVMIVFLRDANPVWHGSQDSHSVIINEATIIVLRLLFDILAYGAKSHLYLSS